MNYITWIEHPDKGHYLAIGTSAPWDRKVQIKVPKWVAKRFK